MRSVRDPSGHSKLLRNTEDKRPESDPLDRPLQGNAQANNGFLLHSSTTTSCSTTSGTCSASKLADPQPGQHCSSSCISQEVPHSRQWAVKGTGRISRTA